jgi:hypothetical protein
MRLSFLAYVFVAFSLNFSRGFAPVWKTSLVVSKGNAVNAISRHVSASNQDDDSMIPNTRNQLSYEHYDGQQKLISLLTATSIFLASSMVGSAICPVPSVHAVETASSKATTATVTVQPLAKEKQNVVDAKTKVASAASSLNSAVKGLNEAKSVESKAADAVTSAQSKIVDAKKQYLAANDKLVASRGMAKSNLLETLTEKVGKAKELLVAVESTLAQPNAAKSLATKAVLAMAAAVTAAERNLQSAKNALKDAEKRLEQATVKLSEEKKAAAEAKKRQQIKEEKAAAEKRKQDKINADKKRKKDQENERKAAIAAKEKAAAEAKALLLKREA